MKTINKTLYDAILNDQHTNDVIKVECFFKGHIVHKKDDDCLDFSLCEDYTLGITQINMFKIIYETHEIELSEISLILSQNPPFECYLHQIFSYFPDLYENYKNGIMSVIDKPFEHNNQESNYHKLGVKHINHIYSKASSRALFYNDVYDDEESLMPFPEIPKELNQIIINYYYSIFSEKCEETFKRKGENDSLHSKYEPEIIKNIPLEIQQKLIDAYNEGLINGYYHLGFQNKTLIDIVPTIEDILIPENAPLEIQQKLIDAYNEGLQSDCLEQYD